MAIDKKLVVVDIDIPQLQDNQLFDRNKAFKVSHTILPICYLYEQAKNRKIEMITADDYLKNHNGEPALLMSYLISPFTEQLIAAGVKPTILLCLESPFIATRFYVALSNFSSCYKHSFVFSGMKQKLNKKTIYHQMFFPESFDVKSLETISFSKKKFLTMISGNKKNSSWKKNLIIRILYGWDIKEIYNLRQRVINFFASKGGFDLYGMGWDKGATNQNDDENIKKVYLGPVEDKRLTLKNYKFAFCFENSIFSGYVTEKIFDVMFAGVIPVYCGAPDIKSYVDAGCFVDIRDYKNFDDLYKFLISIDEIKYGEYISNIKNYLHSVKYIPFTQQNHTKQILDILENEF